MVFVVIVVQEGIVRRRGFATEVQARQFRNRALAAGIFESVSDVRFTP